MVKLLKLLKLLKLHTAPSIHCYYDDIKLVFLSCTLRIFCRLIQNVFWFWEMVFIIWSFKTLLRIWILCIFICCSLCLDLLQNFHWTVETFVQGLNSWPLGYEVRTLTTLLYWLLMSHSNRFTSTWQKWQQTNKVIASPGVMLGRF